MRIFFARAFHRFIAQVFALLVFAIYTLVYLGVVAHVLGPSNGSVAHSASIQRSQNVSQQERLELPVVGVMIMNGEHLLVELLRSIDYPVGTLVIFHNTDKDDRHTSKVVQSTIEDIQLRNIELGHSNIRHVIALYHAENLGFSAGVNKILRSTPWAPFWLLVSNDITFHPGMLHEIAREMSSELHSNERNRLCFWGLVGDPVSPYASFILTDQSVSTVGYFDENFWPAYAEDCDYTARLVRANCRIVFEPEVNRFAAHKTSSSLKNAGKHSSYVSRVTKPGPTFNNFDYLQVKWGTNVCNLRLSRAPYMREGGFQNPFDDPTRNVSTWKLNLTRRETLGGPNDCIVCEAS